MVASAEPNEPTVVRGRAASLGLLFVLHGIMFMVQPAFALDRMRNGPLTAAQFRLLGAAELAGGVVLSASAVTRLPRLVVRAASLGILSVLVPATLLHLRKREVGEAVATAMAAGVCASLIYPNRSDSQRAQLKRSDNG